MKQRTILYLALGLNVASLSYSVWLHQHAQEMANEALRERELELVTLFAPKFREISSQFKMGASALPAKPKSLEDLMLPIEWLMTNVDERWSDNHAK